MAESSDDGHVASGLRREALKQLDGSDMESWVTPAMRSEEVQQKPGRFPKAFIDNTTICVPCQLAVRDNDSNRIGDRKWVNDGFLGCEGLSQPVLHCSLCRHVLRAREIARRRKQSEKTIPIPPLSFLLLGLGQGILIHEEDCDFDGADAYLLESFPVKSDNLVRTVQHRHVDPTYLAGCISHCEMSHGDTCGSPDFSWFDEDGPLLLLVDVRNQCLAKASASSRCFALSYVWGGAEQFSVRTTNVESLMQPGSLLSQPLAQTVMDTITLLQGMNERYLWVDVLVSCCVCSMLSGLVDRADQCRVLYRTKKKPNKRRSTAWQQSTAEP